MSILIATILRDRYLQAHEHHAAQVLRRVARALAQNADQEARFLEALQGGLIPGGRIMAAAGTLSSQTLMNCFVQPIPTLIGSPSQNPEPWQRCLAEAATILHSGGGVGYDFSSVAPQGTHHASTPGVAIGPVACLEFFENLCPANRPGQRGGAQMGVLRCDHPDIWQFIDAKSQPNTLRHFNLSVAITDELMRALACDGSLALRHDVPPDQAANPARASDGRWIYRHLRARTLWQHLGDAAWRTGEPGVLFIDTLQTRNNLSYCESITATNPCGEAPLPAYGACALASIDLSRLVLAPFSKLARIDWSRLRTLVEVGVELLDRALDITAWPLPQHATEALAKRRVGLGFLGLADGRIMLGQDYHQAKGRRTAAHIARFMRLYATRPHAAWPPTWAPLHCLMPKRF